MRTWFRGRFGADLPLKIDVPLERVPGTEEMAWRSIGTTLAHLPMIPGFDSPGDYVMTGEWGRGVNSFGFYFVEVRGRHRRFFRVSSGSGAYADASEEVAYLLGYLEGYEQWRARYEARVEQSDLVHNLGVSKAELTLRGGKALSLAKMDEDGPWWALLGEAIEAAG